MDGQFNSLQFLLDVDPNAMAAGVGSFLPGQTDDLLMAMPNALGGFDMRELMDLMNPPSIPANGVRMPSANQSAVVRPSQRMTAPSQRTATPPRRTTAPTGRARPTELTPEQRRQHEANKAAAQKFLEEKRAKIKASNTKRGY